MDSTQEAGTHTEFLIRGHVRSADGHGLARIAIRAFDRDLRSEQQLGEAVTGAAGDYAITYPAAQFRRAEKDRADVIFRLFASSGEPLTTIKASDESGTPLATIALSNDDDVSPARVSIVFNARLTETVDFIVEGVAPVSEYEQFVAQLKPVLDQVALADVTASDTEFLAGETGIDASFIRDLATAARWAHETATPAEAFYGLLRQGLPDSLMALLTENTEHHRTALERSLADSIIPSTLRDHIDVLLESLRRLRAELVLEPQGSLAINTIGALLRTTQVSPDKQAVFVSTYIGHLQAGGSIDSVWDVLRQHRELTPADLDTFETTLQLGTIALNCTPVVEALQKQRRAGRSFSLRDLAELQPTEWRALIAQAVGERGDALPASVPGKDLHEKIANFAAILGEAVERRFPTATVAARLAKDEAFALPHKQDVLTFFANRPDFEIGTAHIDRYVAADGGAALQGTADKEGLTRQLKALQRVAHVAPRYDEMRPLLAAGLTSALAMTRLSPEQFADHYTKAIDGEAKAAAEQTARGIHAAAQQKASQSVSLLVDVRGVFSNTDPRAVRGGGGDGDPLLDLTPDLRTLFGSLDYCACEHCRSVLSAAAYLVDVLQFLRDRAARAAGTSVLDVLFQRRPDVGAIELTCENTNTELPYIDLVNEILENVVAPRVTAEDWRAVTLPPEKHELFQTRRTADQLIVYPEHVNAGAYVRLRAASYPWSLPFDLATEEIRAYLAQLGITRILLIEAVRPSTSDSDRSAIAIARETLRLIDGVWDIIARDSAEGVRAFWGLPDTDLTSVGSFLERSGLTHAELLALLETQFLNPNLPNRAVDIAPSTSCRIDEMRLTGVNDDVLSKVHRFVRLWRALGWTMRDLDRAIRLLGDGTLDATCLLRLSDLIRVAAALEVPSRQVLAFWAHLDTDGDDSLYRTVFWNPASRSQLPASPFDPATLPISGESATRISAHASAVLAALTITARDLEMLLAALTPRDCAALLRWLIGGGPLPTPTDAPLTLATLSFLYRHTVLSRALRLSVSDLLVLKLLTGVDPFDPAHTSGTLRFIELVRKIRDAAFSTAELAYLFLTGTRDRSPLTPTDVAIAAVLDALRARLRAVQQDTAIEPDPDGLQTRRLLTQLNWNPLVVDALVDTLRRWSEETPRAAVRRQLAAVAYAAPLDRFPADVRPPPELQARLSFDRDNRRIVVAGPLTVTERDRLRSLSRDADYRSAIDRVFAAPDAPGQPPEFALLTAAQVDALLDTADHAARFDHLLVPLQARVRQKLGLQAVTQLLSEELDLPPAVLQPLVARYLHAVGVPGARLAADFLDPRFAASSPLTSIVNHPDFASVVEAFRRLHKAALLIRTFRVTPVELPWLFRAADDGEGAIDLNLLSRVGEAGYHAPEAFRLWSRLVDLFRLRDRFGAEGLDAVFTLARNATATEEAIAATIADWGSWRPDDVRTLMNRWRLVPQDFRDERPLVRMRDAMNLAQRLGVTADDVSSWSEPDLTADHAQRVAERVRDAVKARYQVDHWPVVARPIRDRLRERQAAALAAYLVHHPLEWLTAAQVEQYRHEGKGIDSSTLHKYFLIDVEMSACQMTTRIKQAHSTVQLFVQRCLLNLEPQVLADARRDSYWHRWEWMKHYRVWEANRQVFMHPENWIEPDLRDDKTDFFESLEQDLLQNELTDASAEHAFRSYLEKVDTAGRLDICAMYRQPGEPTVLHVVGRTQGTPPVHYYRRQVKTDYSVSWSAWERVDVDIEGDHVVPITWNDQLYLFWPVFLEQTEQPGTYPNPGQQLQRPAKSARAQLAWSRYRDGTWSPKTVSRESVTIPPASEIDLYMQARAGDGGDLLIDFSVRSVTNELRAFRQSVEAFYRAYRDAAEGQPRLDAEQRYRDRAQRRVRPVTTRTGFRVSHTDGTVRALPVRPASFPVAVPGTHLSGMTFVENELRPHDVLRRLVYEETPPDRFAPSVYQLAIPVDPPHGRGDEAPRPAEFEERAGLPAIVPDRVYTVARETDIRGFGADDADDRFLLNTPVFGTRPLLRRLPGSGEAHNRFRVLLPHNQPAPVREFFFQDDTRTFHGEWSVSPSVTREAARLMASVNPADPGFPWFMLFVVAPVLAGAARYEFRSHYHPYVRMLLQRVSTQGPEGLLQRRVQLEPEQMAVPPLRFQFQRDYDPDRAVVRLPGPIEQMDFRADGAYATYNWELFFHAPLMIADKLSKNQRFEEAQRWFHAIFDPTDMSEWDAPRRYWRTKPFFLTMPLDYQRERIDDLLRRMSAGDDDPDLTNRVAQWRANPFNPHLVARTRTTAFQRNVVMKYLDNLIAWGDHLFRQERLEAINEATQLYVLAAEILGPRPQRIVPRAKPPARTYYQLAPFLDDFSNALIRIENTTPPPVRRRGPDGVVDREGSPRLADERPVTARSAAAGPPTLTLPADLYFCITPNAKLLGYWDTVADRLLKIRHCRNIEGVERQLPLFDPAIDPALLVRAAALGIDLRAAIGDLGAPRPHYRFPVLLQKAAELCADVRGFGAALLGTLEKRDAEEMARLRSTQEVNILGRMKQIREQQVAEADRAVEALKKSKEVISVRREHYAGLKFMNAGETVHAIATGLTLALLETSAHLELHANLLHAVPNVKAGVPTTVGATFGGDNLGQMVEAFAKYIAAQAGILGTSAGLSATLGTYDRRQEDWDLQVKLADAELVQIERQIAAAEIRAAIARQDLGVHELQTRHARETADFLRSKFANRELYDWMARQLSTIYFQSYQLAYDMAKRAERAFQFESGTPAGVVQFGHWDSLRKGLMAGERLQMDLRRLELAYLDQNQREHELTRHVSLALHDPFALHLLRTTGKCTVRLPERLFDGDHPGHYMRRIKSVALTLPAVVGPYTSVNCRLTLQSSAVRITPALRSEAGRRYRPDDDLSADERFRVEWGSVQSIATSRGHSDAGLFELSFRDERYLPFEGAGAISTWLIELDPRCNDFDLATLSDVVLEVHYTARDGGPQLREQCLTEVVADREGAPRGRLFSARTDFADAWHAFLHPIDTRPDQTLVLDLDRNRFPFRARQREIRLQELHVVLMLSEEGRRNYPRAAEDALRVVIRDGRGNVVTPPASDGAPEGLGLTPGGDPRVGAVPGGPLPLLPPVIVSPVPGANRWRIIVPSDSVPAALQAPPEPGRPTRIAAEMIEDLLVFAVF